VEQISGVAPWDRGRPARTEREARKRGGQSAKYLAPAGALRASRPRSEKRLLLIAKPFDEQPKAVFDLGLRIVAQQLSRPADVGKCLRHVAWLHRLSLDHSP